MEVPSEVIQRYLQRRKIEVEECKKFQGQSKIDSHAKLGHQLKGNGKTFGFPVLSTLGEKLEDASNNKNSTLMDQYLNEIYQFIVTRLS